MRYGFLLFFVRLSYNEESVDLNLPEILCVEVLESHVLHPLLLGAIKAMG